MVSDQCEWITDDTDMADIQIHRHVCRCGHTVGMDGSGICRAVAVNV
jgi:hypothetical protein